MFLISFDTLRADHLGCYGYSKETSPNIDRFSEDGVLFETVIAQAASTKPSHASIFTAKNVMTHGACGGDNITLPEENVTMAEILKKNGYHTICYNSGGYMRPFFQLDQGFDIYDSSVVGTFQKTVDATKNWINGQPDEKFFMFMHTYEVHHPYQPRLQFARMFDTGYDGPLPQHISIELLREINDGKRAMTPADRAHIITCYDAEIRSMDEAFGGFIAWLKLKRLYDDSLIIVTSDHGEEFAEHGRMGWHSHSLFEELIHVPLIIKFPSLGFKGRRLEELVRSIDILPTLLDVLDIRPDAGFEGVSLMPSIQANKVKPLFAISQCGKSITMRSQRWKLMGNTLYDLEGDPEETCDASAMGEKEKKALRSRLKSFKQNRADNKAATAEPDKETLEQLKALGYVD